MGTCTHTLCASRCLLISLNTLVSSFRLPALDRAPQVVVIDHGTIVEQGTHADLISKDGLYKKLVARQLVGGNKSKTDADQAPVSETSLA